MKKQKLSQASSATNFLSGLLQSLNLDKMIARKIVSDPQIKAKMKKVQTATEQFLASVQKIKHLNY